MQLRFVTDFYDVPRDRLAELRDAATPHLRTVGSNRQRWSEMLASLAKPIPPIEEPEPYMGGLVAYLDHVAILDSDPPEYEDFLMDLVEFRGDGWDLIEPRPGLSSMLDPSLFDETRLRLFWEDGDEDRPDVGATLLDDLPVLARAVDGVGENGVLLLHHR